MAFVARSQRRNRGIALIVLAVFVGVAGALSMSFIAGARRSSSVVDRFFGAAPHYDTAVYDPRLERSALLSLPGVERADPQGYVAANVVGANAESVSVDGLTVDFATPIDPTFRVLQGTPPDGTDPMATVVNEPFVQNFHLTVGDQVTVRMYSPDQGDSVAQGTYEPAGPTYVFTIAAVVRPPGEIAVDEPHTTVSRFSGSAMLFSYEFWQQHHDEFLDYGLSYLLALADGPDGIPAVATALPSLVGTDEEPPSLLPDERFSRLASYTTPVGLETTALLALGIGVAIAAGATLVLLLRTEQRFHDRDGPALHALGFSSPQLATVAALRTLPTALAGGAVAMVGAVALSSRFPIGIGRQLELHRGRQVNVAVVLLGTLVTVVLVVGASMIVARQRRRGDATTSRLTIARWFRRTGAPNEAALGAHVAFGSPRGRRSNTAAQGVAGGVVALAVVGAVGMWVGGVDRLYEVPAKHGWAWDAAIGNTNFALLPATTDRLAADPLIAEQTRASFGQATLGGESSELFAVDASGTAPPVIVAGRLPVLPNEVALGTRTLQKLDANIGSTVTMSLAYGEFDPGDGPVPDVAMTVVGTALAPMFGESDLGDVSVVTLDAISEAGGDATPKFVMVRFAGGDRRAISARLDQEFTEDQLTDMIPARVVNMHRVRTVPQLGIVLAGALGTITLGYVIVAGARNHRRELAVLSAIGLAPRGVRRVLMWQGALTASVTVAIGLPLSLLAGSALWRRVADDTGIQPGAVVPPLVFVLVPAALAVAALASVFAAHRLQLARVADVLREE